MSADGYCRCGHGFGVHGSNDEPFRVLAGGTDVVVFEDPEARSDCAVCECLAFDQAIGSVEAVLNPRGLLEVLVAAGVEPSERLTRKARSQRTTARRGTCVLCRRPVTMGTTGKAHEHRPPLVESAEWDAQRSWEWIDAEGRARPAYSAGVYVPCPGTGRLVLEVRRGDTTPDPRFTGTPIRKEPARSS